MKSKAQFIIATVLSLFTAQAGLAQDRYIPEDLEILYEINRTLDRFSIPVNSQLSMSLRYAGQNLDFPQCQRSQGAGCQPADHWTSGPNQNYASSWSAQGYTTPGAAMIVAGVNSNNPYNFGAFGQCVSADFVRNKTVTLSGWVAGAKIFNGYASLWIRADDVNGNSISLNNNYGRGVYGTVGYVQQSIRLHIPVNTHKVCFGGYSNGTGVAYFDDFVLASH